MENQMTKEQVIETTISVLSNISVPVAKKREIADPIEGCIHNLAIVLQMIEAERAANEEAAAAREQEGNENAEPEAEEPEPGMEPIKLPVKKEETEDGRDADAE